MLLGAGRGGAGLDGSAEPDWTPRPAHAVILWPAGAEGMVSTCKDSVSALLPSLPLPLCFLKDEQRRL